MTTIANFNLIERMSRDMKIIKYPNEKWEHYTGRVIYSAIALWIKTCTLDRDLFEEDRQCRSKRYVYQRCSQILSELLALVPEAYNWFWNEDLLNQKDNEDPIRLIRDRMLRSGEIIELGFDTDIAIPNERTMALTESLSRVISIETYKYKRIFSSGLAWLVKESNNVDTMNYRVLRPTEFLNWLFQSVNWETTPLRAEIEYFNPYSRHALSKAWSNTKPPSMDHNIYLGRSELYKDLKDYYLICNDVNGTRWCKLHSFFLEQKEGYRIMLALRKLADNPVKAKVIVHNHMCELRLFSKLPLREEITLQTYCWPKNNIRDTFNYIMPIEIWPYIKNIIETLEMEVE